MVPETPPLASLLPICKTPPLAMVTLPLPVAEPRALSATRMPPLMVVPPL